MWPASSSSPPPHAREHPHDHQDRPSPRRPRRGRAARSAGGGRRRGCPHPADRQRAAVRAAQLAPRSVPDGPDCRVRGACRLAAAAPRHRQSHPVAARHRRAVVPGLVPPGTAAQRHPPLPVRPRRRPGQPGRLCDPLRRLRGVGRPVLRRRRTVLSAPVVLGGWPPGGTVRRGRVGVLQAVLDRHDGRGGGHRVRGLAVAAPHPPGRPVRAGHRHGGRPHQRLRAVLMDPDLSVPAGRGGDLPAQRTRRRGRELSGGHTLHVAARGDDRHLPRHRGARLHADRRVRGAGGGRGRAPARLVASLRTGRGPRTARAACRDGRDLRRDRAAVLAPLPARTARRVADRVVRGQRLRPQIRCAASPANV